jgi:AraC family transcriptional regulator of adaptative response/methylated-DNA-[protein]-cysteine methyltransferase
VTEQETSATAAVRFAATERSPGSILVTETGEGVRAILLGGEPAALPRGLRDRFPKAEFPGGDKTFERWVAEVVGFVEALGRGFDLPLDVGGAVFQRRVLAASPAIPVGTTATYSDIARAISEPTAVRAKAQDLGADRLAVASGSGWWPCWRASAIPALGRGLT